MLTGYFTYGVVIIASLTFYFASDGLLSLALICAFSGGLVAELVNYTIGLSPQRFLSERLRGRMDRGISWIQSRRWLGWLTFRREEPYMATLIKFILYKFVGLLRPASTILLIQFCGKRRIHFASIIIATLVWAGFYSVLLSSGVDLVKSEL